MVVRPLFEGVYEAQRSDGLRILLEENPQSRSVSLGVWVPAGSRDDPQASPGLAHFIEHLLFKGSTTRDGPEISKAIDSVGGHLNAATGRESTVYYSDVPSEGLSTAIEILSDLVTLPAFEPAKLEVERGVVLDEIRGHIEDPEAVAFDRFVEAVWENGHELTHPVLGTAEAIRSLTRDVVLAHHRARYRGRDVIIVASGALLATASIPAMASHFCTGDDDPVTRPQRTPPTFQSGEHRVPSQGTQSHVYLGLPGPAADDPDRYAMEVLNVVFGDGTSSRLFREIREDRGLAYAVGSSLMRYTDAGIWTIYAGTAPQYESEVLDVLRTEVVRLATDRAVAADELTLAKSRLRGMFVLSLESNANRAMRLGTAALSGRPLLSPDEILKRLENVNATDIERVIDRFVRPEALHVTCASPSYQAL